MIRFEDILLTAALGFTVYLFYRLHQARADLPPFTPIPPGAPDGAAVIPLGQFAVRPAARWLVLRAGS
jgi:hypothetical protein